VHWRVRDISYRLLGSPSEGRSLTLAEFEQLIAQLRWQ
jgi:hypothetical protein